MKRKLHLSDFVSERPCVVSSLQEVMQWPDRILDGLCPSLSGRFFNEDGGECSNEKDLTDSEKELRLTLLFMFGIDFSTD